MADNSLEQLRTRDAQLIGSAVKNRFNLFAVERAEGSVVYDAEGRRCLDFGPGAAHVNAGYSHPRVQRAIVEQGAKTLSLASISPSG
jgi:4-aminobutyrate aminotransferase-like enzyme